MLREVDGCAASQSVCTETAAAALRLKEVGMAGIAFYNYGHLRLKSLDHIGAALAAVDRG